MGSLTGVDAPIMAFDASHLNMAIASSDGRVKLFSVAQQRLTADLTQELAGKGASLGSEIYTCIAWGAKASASCKTPAAAPSQPLVQNAVHLNPSRLV